MVVFYAIKMVRHSWKNMMPVKIWLVTTTLSLALPLVASAHSGNNDPGVIHACVSNSTRAVRIVGAAGSCYTSPASKVETAVHWSIVGPPGATGEIGPQGPSGLAPLAGFSCAEGQALVGFDANMQPVCGTVGGGGGGSDPPDADGDGIPDALDFCPTTPNLLYDGGSYCPATVYDINNGATPLGATVVLSNVFVSAVAGSAMTVTVKPGDPGYLGSDASSLNVQLEAILPPPVSSSVNVLGLVTDGPSITAAAVVVVSAP